MFEVTQRDSNRVEANPGCVSRAHTKKKHEDRSQRRLETQCTSGGWEWQMRVSTN